MVANVGLLHIFGRCCQSDQLFHTVTPQTETSGTTTPSTVTPQTETSGTSETTEGEHHSNPPEDGYKEEIK